MVFASAPTLGREGHRENVERLEGFGFAHFSKLHVGDQDERVIRDSARGHAIEKGIVRLEHGCVDDAFTARIGVEPHDATCRVYAILNAD